jgi:hypothetical protein
LVHSRSRNLALWPELSAEWSFLAYPQEKFRRYQQICQIPETPEFPAFFFPFALSFRLQLLLLTHSSFPLPLLGTLHLRSHSIQYAPFPFHQALRIVSTLKPYQIREKGLEFSVHTVLTGVEEPIWEALNFYFLKGKFGNANTTPPLVSLSELKNPKEMASWSLPQGVAFSYARFSGDYNPIHLSTIAAKILGQPRKIVHGAWMAAHLLPRLLRASAFSLPLRLDLQFKGPFFEGDCVSLWQEIQEEKNTAFECYQQKNPKPCIQGKLSTLSPSDPFPFFS